MQQHKLEIKGKLFIRGYTTQKMAETHTTCFYGYILIEFGKMINLVWAVCSYLCYSCFKWVNPENAHIAARNVADTGRLIPGNRISVGF
jgi:hypothetical protein